mmetsp:Transcript_20252/g.47289  ORF Transcript_20252/g.47289 Transcript_20252/m.47289 type:complete len:405 (-) Transcript_20252:86-1300(-)
MNQPDPSEDASRVLESVTDLEVSEEPPTYEVVGGALQTEYIASPGVDIVQLDSDQHGAFRNYVIPESLAGQIQGQPSALSGNARGRLWDKVEILTVIFTTLGVCQHIFSVVATALVVGSSKHAGRAGQRSDTLGSHDMHIILLAVALSIGLCHEFSRVLALLPTRIAETQTGLQSPRWQLIAKASRRIAVNWCMLSIVAGPLHLLQAMVVYFAIMHEHKTTFSVTFVVLAVLEFSIVFVTPSMWNQPSFEEGEWQLPLEGDIGGVPQGRLLPRSRHTEPRLEIRRFELTTLADPPPEAEANCNTMCSICMSSFANGDQISQLPCYHMFHSQCIAMWLEQPSSKGCPMRCQQRKFPVIVPPISSEGSAPTVDDASKPDDEHGPHEDSDDDMSIVTLGEVRAILDV